MTLLLNKNKFKRICGALMLILMMSSHAVLAQNEKAVLKFETEVIDYGTLEKGANGKRIFTFTNSGHSPLVITDVKAACGCTVPRKPGLPILPGEKEKLKWCMTPNSLENLLKISLSFQMPLSLEKFYK